MEKRQSSLSSRDGAEKQTGRRGGQSAGAVVHSFGRSLETGISVLGFAGKTLGMQTRNPSPMT